jgi:hypothetical protein
MRWSASEEPDIDRAGIAQVLFHNCRGLVIDELDFLVGSSY